MKILVTGAAGFIGTFLTDALTKVGHDVIGLDSFTDYYDVGLKRSRITNILGHEGAKQILKVDIKKIENLRPIFAEHEFDVVIHLAAQAGVRLEAHQYVESNIIGFLNILKCVEDFKIRNFMFASSSSVYGNLARLPYEEGENVLQPSSFYGLTKKMNEDFSQLVAKKSNIKIRALRFFTVYGPWGRPDMAYFRLIASALGNREFQLFGDGSIQRDFTYVEDVVQVVIDLMSELISRGNTPFFDRVNIGGARPLSMSYLIKEIERQSGRRILISQKEGNLSDSRTTEASKVYLTQLIGSHNYVTLEEGISRTLQWASAPSISDLLNHWVESSK